MAVRLLGADGVEIARTTSDSTGRYVFAGRASGTYTVVADVPAGLQAIGVWSTGRIAVNLGVNHDYVASDLLLARPTSTLTTSAATQSTTSQAVTPGTPPTPVGSKPSYTGSNPTRAAALGAVSLLLGLALVARRGRRRAGSLIR